MPDDIHVSYKINRFEEINFNLTVEMPFPGKLLMHIFARKLSDQVGGSDQVDLVRFRNLDLCMLLDGLRNMTLHEIPGESLLPSTFVVSCPLMPGFYYVENSTIDISLIPFRLPDGRYMVLLELIQVYEEVMKLATTRIKFSLRRPPDYKEPSFSFNSSEEDNKGTANTEREKKESNEAKEEKKEEGSEVTDPSSDTYEAEEEKKERSLEVTDPNDNYETSTDYNK